MSLSIITPHFNDFNGLKKIYECLQYQTINDWEWIIVDDMSDSNVQYDIKKWINSINDKKVYLHFNLKKSNASTCRNKGVEISSFKNLIFLDSDDYIAPNFVGNRNVHYKDFAVFPNYYISNEKGEVNVKRLDYELNFLNSFLSGNFLWQTTCVLWDKGFLCKINKFNSDLTRLQDVELVIRALQESANFKVLKNTEDFYYNVKPIRLRKEIGLSVFESIHTLISSVLPISKLEQNQIRFLRGYYFICVKYYQKLKGSVASNLVIKNLKLFYKKKIINLLELLIGVIVFKLYTFGLLSGFNFLRINRYFFKPKLKS